MQRAQSEEPTLGDRSHWAHFRALLGDSIGVGAALAALTLSTACGGQGAGEPLGAGSGEQDDDAKVQPTTGSAGAPGTAPAASLEPYPLADVGCFGEIVDSLLYGPQCCFEARCYTPPDGAACATDLRAAPELSALLPLGSGSCGCAVPEEGRPQLAGPYAPNPAAESPFPAGACCYVVGAWGCTGRPFVFDGVGHLAAVAYRADWGLLG